MAAKAKKILTASIFVRDPKTDEPVFLEAGTPVPHGFGKLISDDHFVTEGTEVKKETTVVETTVPEANAPVTEVVEEFTTEAVENESDELDPDNAFETE